MRKFLFFFGFFALAVFIAGLKASEAEAVTTYHSGTFKNYGSITVYATYWIYNGSGQLVTFSDGSQYKTVGPLVPGNSDASGNFQPTENAYNPTYQLWWSTHCVDPAVPGTTTGQFNGVNIVAYGAIDVSAKTPCGEPAITTISCPSPGTTLSASWQMTGGGPYNVAYYNIFFGTSLAQVQGGNVYQGQTTSTSWSKTGLSPGTTYYVRVNAVSPQGQWSSPAYSNTVCQSLTVPPAPTVQAPQNVPACSDTTYGGSSNVGGPPNIKTTFTVSGATGALEELYANGVQVQRLNWFLGTLDPNQTYNLSGYFWNLSPNTLYTWRVRAGNSVGDSTFVSGQSWGPLPSCGPGKPTNLTSSVPACSDTSFSASFSWSTGGGSPTKTEFKIEKSSAVVSSSSWAYVATSHSVSNLQPTYTYFWYVRFGDASGLWSDWSGQALNYVPYCSLPDLTITDFYTDKASYEPNATVYVTIKVLNVSLIGVPVSGTVYIAYSHDIPGVRDVSSILYCAWQPSLMDEAWGPSGMAANTPITYTSSFTAPGTSGTYKMKAMIDSPCWVNEANENNNVADTTFNVASLPTNPSNLSVTVACAQDNNPAVRFSWTDSANETGYYLDVNGAAWTGPSAPSPWGYKTLGANVINFNWHPNTPLTGGSILAPTASTTYWWRLVAFNASGQSQHVYPPSTTTPPGGSFTTPDCIPNLKVTDFAVPNGSPGQPVNATYTVTNSGLGYANNFKVAVNKNSSTMDCFNPTRDATAGPMSLASGNLANNTSYPLSFTLPSTPGTYTAVIMADSDCVVSETNESLNPADGENVKLATYTVSGFDLSASFVAGSMRKSDGTPSTSFKAGDTIKVDLQISNSQLANVTSLATGVGVWPNKTNTAGLPNCSVPTAAVPPAGTTFSTNYYTDGVSGNVGALAPNTSLSAPITVTFAAAANPGIYTVYAYVIPSCSPTDYRWNNNGSNTGTNTINGADVPNVSISYSVSVDSWFETNGGDVGSKGGISVSQVPPLGRWQSGYLLARANFDTSVASKWRIDNYTKPLVAANPYTYLAERFLDKANVAPYNTPLQCLLQNYDPSTGRGLGPDFSYCPGSTIFLGSDYRPSSPCCSISTGRKVWFIKGNADFWGNVTLENPSDTLIIIAGGNININTDVTRIDAVLIAGGTIRTTTNDTTTAGNQLVVNGALYGTTVNLNRKISSPGTCTYNSATKTIVAAFSCSNTTDPAEVVRYDPRYLIALNDLLGSPGVSWKEVAP